MIESALGQLIGSILAGSGAGAAHTSKKLNDTLPKEEEPEIKSKKEETPKAEERELTKQEKADLEYLLVAGGLSTKEAKQALSGDLIPRKMLKNMDRDVLKQIADITGKNGYEDFIYDGDKLGKGYTSIPLTKANKPKGETMPVPEKKKGSDTTTTKGEKAKDKKTVMKGEDAKKKDTVMEIPEEDLSRLIELVGHNDPDWNSPELSKFAMKKGMHLRDVVKQVQDEWEKSIRSCLKMTCRNRQRKMAVSTMTKSLKALLTRKLLKKRLKNTRKKHRTTSMMTLSVRMKLRVKNTPLNVILVNQARKQ